MKRLTLLFLLLLIIAGTVFQNVGMVKSGVIRRYGVGYWGPLARDGIWHEALIAQLQKNLSPENPGLAGTKLENYHYFYDLLAAKTINFWGFPRFSVVYIIFPIIFSVLLGIGTFLLAKRLFVTGLVSLGAVFFAYFGSSFGWVIDIFRKREIGGESAFWANQPVSMNLNPPFALSLVIIIFFLLFLDSVNFLKKPTAAKTILLSFLAGTLIGIKAYAGAVVLFALFILTLKKVLIDKSYALLPVLATSSLISFVISLNLGLGSSLLLIQPFWLIDTMIDAGDRVGIPNFTARRFAYLASNKWIHLGIIETVSFLIFFIGNLGTRMVAIFGFKKKHLEEDIHLFIFSAMLFSLVVPLVFIQKGNPWNIVQFFYYFLYFVSLYAAGGLGKIYQSLPRRLSIPVIVVLILVTPISSVATFRSWLYPNPPAYLPSAESKALGFLSNQEDGVVLKHPYDASLRDKFKDPYPLAVYADNAYVSAYSGKAVFIEDVEQQIILQSRYEERLEKATRFFKEKDLSWSEKFLRENKIEYLYLPKLYELPMVEGQYPMKKIFENEEVNIYQVVP